ncbi:MAG: potassium/proton antiporter [Thermoflexales bacterium]|nr:potassium/proton antiporter [Thermoflexales bacterium]MCS7324350.1 potassium/proton antiporter [Thermoflexales bacterium]MCX7938929.1 potassium/proton antiporter [Thermoflexales bacterium]MDW8054852.1 potassium/proton antiporter [Anaerolineae bacterium]MDW8293057.1 potassium/proton antiporter [Anaerolineae bacterium]
MLESTLILIALLLLLSALASKASGRLGVPALVFFLMLGMLMGPGVTGWAALTDLALVQGVSVVALVVILFSGGLDTEWRSVRPVLGVGVALATLGVLLTALLTAAFAIVVLKLEPLKGFLLGAIVSSTDAAAVFSILRSKDVRLKPPLEPALELESGSNDPLAVLLTLGTLRLLTAPPSAEMLLLWLAAQFVLGGALGVGIGYAAVHFINHVRLRYDGLYSVISVAVPLLTYGLTTLLNGNGFLAVYLAGLVMNRFDFVHKNTVKRFHDSLAWLMQITMFLTLGLLVAPLRLVEVVGVGLAVAAYLMLVARPLSVWLALWRSSLDAREKLLIGWVGLRGAAPIILATFPLAAGVESATLIFDVVFFVVVVSVLLQGMTIVPLARKLKLEAKPAVGAEAHRRHLDLLRRRFIEVAIPRGGVAAGQQVVDLRLPPAVLIAQVVRGEEAFVPNGSTVLEEGDVLLIITEPALETVVREKLETRRANPFFAD